MRYYATQVTPDNLNELIAFGAQNQFNLRHLLDSFQFNAEDGLDTYLTMQLAEDDFVLTFNDITSSEFGETWKFGTDTTGPLTKITRI